MSAREGEADDVGGLCAADPLARHLASMKPVPAAVDRDRLMFAAGAAAHDRAGTWWKRAFYAQSGVVAAAVLVFAGGVIEPTANRTPDSSSSPMANVQPPPAAPSPKQPATSVPRSSESFAADPDAGKWLQLRADVFAAGVGVLPTPASPPPVPDVSAVEKSLQLDPGVLAVPYRPKPPPEPDSP